MVIYRRHLPSSNVILAEVHMHGQELRYRGFSGVHNLHLHWWDQCLPYVVTLE